MTPTSTITNSTLTAVAEPENGEKKKEKGKMIVVDWYGPDDPENPQNWYVPYQLCPKVDINVIPGVCLVLGIC
jgi:hypothetical protein